MPDYRPVVCLEWLGQRNRIGLLHLWRKENHATAMCGIVPKRREGVQDFLERPVCDICLHRARRLLQEFEVVVLPPHRLRTHPLMAGMTLKEHR